VLTPNPVREAVLITSESRSAAYISSYFARRGAYFVVMDPPWLPDGLMGSNEVVRCNNVLAKIQPRSLILGPMKDTDRRFLERRFRALELIHLPDLDAIMTRFGKADARRQVILDAQERDLPRSLWECLRDEAGAASDLVCLEPYTPIEDIAVANLAIATASDFAHIDLSLEDSDVIDDEEGFLRSARTGTGPILGRAFSHRIPQYHTALNLARYRTATFVTKTTPHGLAAPEHVITAHIPRLGGMARLFTDIILAESAESWRTYMGLVVDPGFFEGTEAEPVGAMLRGAGWNVRQLLGASCTYEEFDFHVQFFPNDLLLTATHGGEVSGDYVVFRFADSKGVEHQFECEEVALFSHAGAEGLVRVSILTVPVRLDGVVWDDDEGKERIGAGDLLRRFLELYREHTDEITVLNRYDLPRVNFSNAVVLHGGAFHFLGIHSFGYHERPVVFNNACSSWADLGRKVMFAGGRAYVCTARSVGNEAATQVAVSFFGAALGGTPLAEALHAACAGVPEARGIYVFAGLPFSTLHSPPAGANTRRRWHDHAMQLEAGLTALDNREPGGRGEIDLRQAIAFIRRVSREV
jgi:hypothetical protein